VYSIQSRLGEGAYAKIYRIVPKAGESKSDEGKVIKVCSHPLSQYLRLAISVNMSLCFSLY